jgi:hypothetical protein
VGRGDEEGQCSGAQFNEERRWGGPGLGEVDVGSGLQLPTEIPAEGGIAWPGWQGPAVGDTVGMGPDFVAMDIGGPSTYYECSDFGGGNAQYTIPVNTGVTPAFRRRRRARVDSRIPELSGDSVSDISEYETDEDEDGNSGLGDVSGVQHAYGDETWSTKFFTYDPKPKEFLGRMGTTKFFAHIPSILTLFELFWPFTLMHKIVIETNRYATHVLDALGNTRGGGGMDQHLCGRNQSIFSYPPLHGYEKATQCEIILE